MLIPNVRRTWARRDQTPSVSPQKIQYVEVFEQQSGGKVAFAADDGRLLADHCIELFGERRALIEHRVDGRTKGTHAPAFDPGHLRVEFPLEGLSGGKRALKWDQLNGRDSVATISCSREAPRQIEPFGVGSSLNNPRPKSTTNCRDIATTICSP